MSVKVMTWVFDHSDARGNDRLVLLALADHADDETWSCWPGVERIALKARVERSTAFRCLKRLEAARRIAVESGGGRHRTNRYTVLRPEEGSQTATVSPAPNTVAPGAETVAPATRNSGSVATPTIREPSEPPMIRDPHDFDAFWNAYPRKVGKRTAEVAYQRAVKRAPTVEAIHAGVERLARAIRESGTEQQFVPHPATWLNRDGWNDVDVYRRQQPRAPRGADATARSIERLRGGRT